MHHAIQIADLYVGKNMNFIITKVWIGISFLSCDLGPCNDEDKVGLYVRIDIMSMLHVPFIALNNENSIVQGC